jgi:chromosome segregation ATPase
MHVADETERRINQLYNDVHAIYDQLGQVQKVQKVHTQQLKTLNKTVAGIWATQQQHGEKLNSLDAALAVLTEQVAEQSARLGVHDRRFDEVDRRFGEVDKRFDEVDRRFDAQDGKIDTLREQVNGKLDLIMKALDISAN